MPPARAALVAASLLVASPALAEPPAGGAAAVTPAPAATSAANPAEPLGDRIGFGVGIGSASTTPVLYVPLDFGVTRVEIEGAYAKGGTEDLKTSTSHLGLGVFGLWGVGPEVRGSAGGRVQWGRATVNDANADAFRVAAALGAEWVPVRMVSLGVEAQAGYTFGSGGTVSGFDVSAQAILRVFLSSSTRSESKAAEATRQSAPPAGPRKCAANSDCDGRDICFGGVCRH